MIEVLHVQAAAASNVDPMPTWKKHANLVKKLSIEYFLPLAFLLACIAALAYPAPGRVVGSWQLKGIRIVQAINNFVVFLISGLTLRNEHLRSAIRHWHGTAYGLVAILAITPCLGFAFKVSRMMMLADFTVVPQ